MNFIEEWANYWSYGMAQPAGAQPKAEDDAKAESLGARARDMVIENRRFLAGVVRSAIAEPCQRLGCRYDVAQSMLDRAKEYGELSEDERRAMTNPESATRVGTRETAADASPAPCYGCGKPLLVENAGVYDGCPCNTPRGVNDSNLYRWRLLLERQQEDSRRAEEAERAARADCKLSGIYVASRVKQAEVWKAYRARGWKINASWIDEAGEGETADFGDLWERIRGEIARSHTLVFYAAGVEDFPFKGALVEVGMALAMGKPVLVALENVTLDGRTMRPVGSWLLDRKVQRFDTLEEAMDIASGVEILCTPRPEASEHKP